jgi:hypothetical protein
MHFTPILLSLATAASAIDIRFFTGSKCNGGAELQCGGIGANTCCQIGYKVSSIGFFAIPTNWNVVTRSYVNGNACRGSDKANEFRNNGAATVCHGTQGLFAGNYRGGGYSFVSKRRAIDASDEEACVKPNLLVLEDGQKYKIDGLDDDVTEQMVYCPT